MFTLCGKCKTPFVINRTGVAVLTHNNGKPSQLWFADEWKCKCERKIISGWSEAPMMPEDGEGYQEQIERAKKAGTLIKIPYLALPI